MVKDKLKVQQNQHSNANSSYNRLMRRSRAFWRLAQAGVDPQWLYNYIDSKVGVGKELTPQLMEHILFMASRGLFCFASTKWLASLMDCHKKSVCRISKELADLGIIRKWYRGVGRSVALLLNPIFNNPIIQFTLAGLFPFLKVGAISFIISADGAALKSLPSFCRSDLATHVTYNKNLTPLRNSKSCNVLKAQQSGGETPVKCSVVGRGVPETPLIGSWGEKLRWKTPNVPIDPRDKYTHYATAGVAKVLNVYPRKLRTATAANISSIKRSGEYEFVPEPAPIKATNESFDNNPSVYLGEREMPEDEVPFLEESVYAEASSDQVVDWEEVYEDVQVGSESIDSQALPEVILLHAQPERLPEPPSKAERPEAFVSAPIKPWNAPPWRKVTCQEDVEGENEYVLRLLNQHLKKREDDAKRATWSQRTRRLP